METLAVVLMKFYHYGFRDYEETMCALIGIRSYLYVPKKLDLDLINYPSPPAKPSINEPPTLELKDLPGQLRYVFLGNGNTLPITIATDLVDQ